MKKALKQTKKTLKIKPISILGILSMIFSITILFYIKGQVPVLFDLSMNVKYYGDKLVILIIPFIALFFSILHLFYEKEEKINKTFNNIIIPILVGILVILGTLYSIKAFNYSSPNSLYNNISILVIIGTVLGTLISILSTNFNLLHKIVLKFKNGEKLEKLLSIILFIFGIVFMYTTILSFLFDTKVTLVIGISILVILLIVPIIYKSRKKI